MVLTTLKH